MKYRVVRDNDKETLYAIYYKKHFFSEWVYFGSAFHESEIECVLDKLNTYREKYTIIEEGELDD